jgi:hypothetical protein
MLAISTRGMTQGANLQMTQPRQAQSNNRPDFWRFLELDFFTLYNTEPHRFRNPSNTSPLQMYIAAAPFLYALRLVIVNASKSARSLASASISLMIGDKYG